MKALLAVEVVYCAGPGLADRVPLLLDAGATVSQALQASGLLQRHALDPGTLEAGIWGRACPPDTVLRTADRIEIYRPLQVDPKEARRQRHRQQRTAKPAGGAKSPAPDSGPQTPDTGSAAVALDHAARLPQFFCPSLVVEDLALALVVDARQALT